MRQVAALYGHGLTRGAVAVNPLTASAFDLADHLAHKADPDLIFGDEQHFATIARRRWTATSRSTG